jgi:pyruvate carboxylase
MFFSTAWVRPADSCPAIHTTAGTENTALQDLAPSRDSLAQTAFWAGASLPPCPPRPGAPLAGIGALPAERHYAMTPRLFRSVLVANRGEIAIRIFRACAELGIRTLGIYSQEDKTALHRYKADETYLVGKGLPPLHAYLDVDEILAVARRHGAEAIHPGYGFLAENAEFARRCEAAGIAFVGPPAEVLERMGDKVAARETAQTLGIPVVPGTPEPLPDEAAALAAAEAIGYPVILKASFGGGGRGMRVAADARELRELFADAAREAQTAFGRGDLFLEKYLRGPKHIEVQVLGDAHGNVVHLFERDCTVQRRHQKIVEVAPAPFLADEARTSLCEAAVALARAVGYVNAGTVEFLLDGEGNHYFMEMNPRIQVEHTITEWITGIDIVKSQLHVAAGFRLADPQIRLADQGAVRMRGYAIQCRITTEDPANNFVPDYGRITHYRSPAGFGIRLDGGTAFTGAIITPFYDSLLVKVSAWSLDFRETCLRLHRALSEFRVHGVRTNIPFLQNIVSHPVFQEGRCTTTFIEETPSLFQFAPRRDRASRLLEFLSEITVNGNPTLPPGARRTAASVAPRAEEAMERSRRQPQVPPHDADAPPPPGTREIFLDLGPERFSRWVLEQDRLLVTDTTFRDAHQSLLATRVRTYDMARVAPAVARQLAGLFSMEVWGGATFDVAMRFLHEDPWERLQILRERIPNILFQMLLRGANAVGYANYPTNVVRRFTQEAADAGIDLFRIFDSLNFVPAMRPAIEAAREAGALVEAAICYTGDLFDPDRPRYHLPYYLELARELERLGANLLGIKDMAGLCRPYAARELVRALKQEVGIPIHFHTHDTAGGQMASLLFAAEAGVDIVDMAISSMAGLTSQPSLETLVAALQRQPRDTGLDPDLLMPHADYWRAVREQYTPFESDLRAPSPDVYLHEIPGGQYSNLGPQAEAMGLGDRIPELKRMYAVVNEMLGDIVKVTPSSKVVGDLAIMMLTHSLTPQSLLERGAEIQFPESVLGFFAGEIGIPPGGFPEALRRVILKDRPLPEYPPGTFAGESLPPVDFDAVRAELQDHLRERSGGKATPALVSDRDVLSYLMYPRVFTEYAADMWRYSDFSPLPTDVFFYGLAPGEETEIEIEPGKTLFVKLVAIASPDEQGIRTLFYELNGNPREVRTRDLSAGATQSERRRADPANLHHLGAPMPGAVAEVKVKPGDVIKKGDHLLTLEAMKVFMHVNSPLDAKVKDVLVAPPAHVESGDLLVVFE